MRCGKSGFEKAQVCVLGIHIANVAVGDVGGYAIAEKFFVKQLTHQGGIGPANFTAGADKGFGPGSADKRFTKRVVAGQATGRENGFST